MKTIRVVALLLVLVSTAASCTSITTRSENLVTLTIPQPDFTQNMSPAFSVGFEARLGAEWAKAFVDDMPIDRIVGVSCGALLSRDLKAMESVAAFLSSDPIVKVNENGSTSLDGKVVDQARYKLDRLWEAAVVGIQNSDWVASDEIIKDSASSRISLLLTFHFKMRSRSDEFAGALLRGHLSIIIVCTNQSDSAQVAQWGSVRCCILADTNTQRVLAFRKEDSLHLLRLYRDLLVGVGLLN